MIDGVPSDIEEAHPDVAMLAEAYVSFVKGELAHHDGNAEHALWTGLAFGPLFAQMWASASSLRLKELDVPVSFDAFRGSNDQAERAKWLVDYARQLPEYKIVDWIAVETLQTAEILARAYVKCFAELAVVCEQSDIPTIRHHSALLGELLADMLNLVTMGGERTDLRLPDTHLHKKIAIEQESVRSPKGAELWS
ncbi:hypothetical protein GFL92_01100 [Rhizobium leguminosarum bv. viciae]|nr:hypothetical protein [Rhizobium leguminosarum bv. viciae]